jgi:hypothetical protein
MAKKETQKPPPPPPPPPKARRVKGDVDLPKKTMMIDKKGAVHK